MLCAPAWASKLGSGRQLPQPIGNTKPLYSFIMADNRATDGSTAMFFFGVSWVSPGCLLGVSWVSPGCLLGVSWVSPGCLLGVSWVPPGCRLGAAWVSPGCLLGVSWVSPGCLLGVALFLTVQKKTSNTQGFAMFLFDDRAPAALINPAGLTSPDFLYNSRAKVSAPVVGTCVS